METIRIEIRGNIEGKSLRSAALFMVGKLNLTGTLKMNSFQDVLIEITGDKSDNEQLIVWLREWLHPGADIIIVTSKVDYKWFAGFSILAEPSNDLRSSSPLSYRKPSLIWKRFLKSMIPSKGH